jgi:LCP family protein required for cell wall assembly
VAACALVAAACSGQEPAPTTVAPSTSAAPTAPPTTAAPTIVPPTERVLFGVMPEGVRTVAQGLYSWLAEPGAPPGGLPPGLIDHLSGIAVAPGPAYARFESASLSNGDQVGVLTAEGDALLLADVGNGWHIVGAMLEGATPWLGDTSPRTLLVIGSDARVGEDQLGLRADSVHLLTLVPEIGEGAIVGFPRDSWVRGGKLTNLMPGRGPDYMVEVIEEITGIDMEGWVAVGFEGFLGLMEELGSLEIDLPRAMRSGNNWADYPAGPQTLTPQLALRLARIRKGLPAGDFDRSFNQGLIMLAAMTMIQQQSVLSLPRWIAAYDRHGFTNLDTEPFLTWAAGAFVASPDSLSNVVVPGRNGSVGSAAVVFISDSAETLFRDLDDGVIDAES